MVENLRIARKAKGMSQQNLADAIGVSQQAIHQYETDKIEPDIENLKRLADTLSVSVDFLVAHRLPVDTPYTVVNEDELLLIENYRCMKTNDKKFIKRIVDNLTR